MLADGKVECQNCGKTIDAVGDDVLIYGGHSESRESENVAIICLLFIIFLFVPWYIAIPAIACILLFKGVSGRESDSERKIVRQDSQGPSVR